MKRIEAGISCYGEAAFPICGGSMYGLSRRGKDASRPVNFSGLNPDLGLGLILCICTAAVCYFFCMRQGMFASRVDWINQHSVLPDYFRKQFYETGNLFPEFAANLGGGQNIYNFSYYGLYSPIVLVSYLLPFVKMSDYMMAAQLVSLAASVVLLYVWLVRRGFIRSICFFTALVFLLSGPMVFHSHNQIMFVNYMPFLCMGFLGAERYFEKGRAGLLTASVFLMIMTSFYFSIGGMAVLGLYGLHRNVEKCGRWQDASGKRRFLAKEAFGYCAAFLTAVLMAAVLLVPTAAALTGRGDGRGVREVDARSLFVPGISFGRFFYSPYGIGLTTFMFTVITAMAFSRTWKDRILAWGCAIVFTVPVFTYLLNGGLYVRNKVMIPFLPLLCYMTACYMKRLAEAAQKRDKASLFYGAVPYVSTLCILCLCFIKNGGGQGGKYLIMDSILMLLCYGVFCVRGNVLVLLSVPLLLLALSGSNYNLQDKRQVTKQFYEKITGEDAAAALKKAVDSEKVFYRAEQLGSEEEDAANMNRVWDMGQYVSTVYSSLYNKDYLKFRKGFGAEQPFRNCLMQPAVHNPVYQRFMGVKYLSCDKKLYENRAASPAAYATNKVIGEGEYKKLVFPENQLSLLHYAVVGKGRENGQGNSGGFGVHNKQTGCESLVHVPVSLPKEINSGKKKTYSIDISKVERGTKRNLKADGCGTQEVLFLRFHVENLRPAKDAAIWLEGQKNKLSSRTHIYYNENTVFTYAVLLEQQQRQAELVFGEGHYKISDVQCFLGELPSQRDTESLYQSKLILDKKRTSGNVIAGDIAVQNDGYFITTIPYDKNFKIIIDGKNAGIEKVNTAFLGCRIERGGHKVSIVYHAPGTKAGKAVSATGMLLFLFEVMLSHKFFVTAHQEHDRIKRAKNK